MWFGRPSPRYAIDVADSAHGIWTQPRHAANWSGVSGASLAPKSTVRFVIALMPPPEPIGPYVILRPSAESTLPVQAATSGATNELPAPVSSEPCGRACAEPAIAASATATAVTSTPSIVMAFLLKSRPSRCSRLESTVRACARAQDGWADAG